MGSLSRGRTGVDPRRGALQDPPDHEEEGDGHGDERRGEEPQRSVENRLRLHARLDVDWRAAQALGERLLPDEDVAAADVAAGVVEVDLARKMQPEGDELAAVPPACTCAGEVGPAFAGASGRRAG